MSVRFRAFGLDVDAAFPLSGLPPHPHPAAGPGLRATLADAADVAAAWSGSADPPRRVATEIDGLPYSAEHGAKDDLLLRWGDSSFHLSSDGSTLLCAPADPDTPGWRRLLLDSVLATAAMRSGSELIHAGAVSTSGGLLAVLAGTGGGKTSLVAALLDRGGRLFCDDLLAVHRAGSGIVCEPGPPLMNLALEGPVAHAGRGTELARLGDEAWVSIDSHCTAAELLAAFVVLERTPDAGAPELTPDRMPHLALMAGALNSGSTPERRELRFRVMSDLAETTPGFKLRAPLDTPPAELAELAEQALTARTARTAR